MYDELVHAQEPSKLERFVLNAVIPSLLLTSLIHKDVVWAAHSRQALSESYGKFSVQIDTMDPGNWRGERLRMSGCMISVARAPKRVTNGMGHAR